MSAILVDDNLLEGEDTSAIEAARDLNDMQLEEVKEELDGESASIRPGDQQDFMDDEDDCFREVVNNLESGPKHRSLSERPTVSSLQDQIDVLKDQLLKAELDNE